MEAKNGHFVNIFQKNRILAQAGFSSQWPSSTRRCPMPNKKVAFLYRFNPESYNEMKEKGFRLVSYNHTGISETACILLFTSVSGIPVFKQIKSNCRW